jgi:hypothetical protein
VDSLGRDAALTSGEYAWLPFVAALAIILAAPWFFNLAWSPSYDAYYRKYYSNPNPTHGQLLAGAEWAVEIAGSVPNGALTLIGIVMLGLPISTPILVVVCILVALLLWGVALREAHRQRLTEVRRTVWNRYSRLTWVQVALNVAGLVIALVLQ